MRTIRKRNWFLRRLVLGFTVAALLAPAAAQARVDEAGVAGPSKSAIATHKGESSWPGVDPTNGQNYPQWSSSAKAVSADEPISGKGQSSWPGIDPTSGQSYPRWSSSAEVVSADGFGWDDAGVGIGIALGLVLLGGVAFRVTRHRGDPQTACEVVEVVDPR